MKIGLVISKFDWPQEPESVGPNLLKIARAAEAAGFDSIWVYDHFFQIGAVSDPMLEAYTTLGFLAAVTKRVKLGTLVAGVIYREPALLVKAATALDVISGGRAYFGIGAAWYEEEAKGLGFTFPSTATRFEQLEETLQIAKQMWAGDTSSFHGNHFQLEKPINSPKPITKPHPPILIGGEGERKTLKLVAKYADATNMFARTGRERLVHKLDVLKKHCDSVGRNFDEIEKTLHASVGVDSSSDADEIKRGCEAFAKIGFQHIMFSVGNAHEITPLEVFGKEVIPQVKNL